jgi:hypothetical protein
VRTRPKKSKTPQFILDLQKPGANADQHSVEQAMVQLERDSTDRTAVRNIRKLKPVIKVLSDYSNVLDTLGKLNVRI